jgi:PRTRC genetic system protein E
MLFETLAKMMGSGEHIVFTIQKDGGERLCVSVQPMLAQGPENPSEAIQQMRTGLAMPLIVRATAQEFDGPAFMDALQDYKNARLAIHDGLASALGRVKDGLKGARNASIKQAATVQGMDSDTGDDGESRCEGGKPPGDENPDSLF